MALEKTVLYMIYVVFKLSVAVLGSSGSLLDTSRSLKPKLSTLPALTRKIYTTIPNKRDARTRSRDPLYPYAPVPNL